MYLFKRSTMILVVALLTLSGCVHINGPLEYANENETNTPSVNYLPVGIPFLLGGHGTSVPITSELSLTAKHVAKIDFSEVVAYHPDCDIALIKEENTGKKLASLGKIHSQESIKTFGRGLTGKTLVGEGKYYQDVNFVDSKMFARCPASITDAAVQSGMSGGGAFNAKGQLVGIISGMSGSRFRMLDGSEVGNERTSIFVSTYFVRDWLISEVEQFYGDTIEHLAVTKDTFTTAFLKD